LFEKNRSQKNIYALSLTIKVSSGRGAAEERQLGGETLIIT